MKISIPDNKLESMHTSEMLFSEKRLCHRHRKSKGHKSLIARNTKVTDDGKQDCRRWGVSPSDFLEV